MASYSTTDLLRGVRRLGFLPDASDLTDADLLEFADEEQVSLISAAIKLEREEHYVTSTDYSLNGSLRSFAIPARAMGRMVRGIILVSPTGITYPCPEIDPVKGWFGRPTSAMAWCHSISGDSINLPGPGPPGWTMRVFYLRRPSTLCLVSEAAPITGISTATLIKLTSVPTWIAANVPTLMDMIYAQPPFDARYNDLIMASVSGTDLTLNAATPVDPSIIAAGSPVGTTKYYLTQRGQSCFPEVPAEFFPALEAAVCRRALEAIGDRQGVDVVSETYGKRVQAAIDITSPRDESGGRAIVRRSSTLRSGGGWGWGRARGRRGWR